ncbi:serine/threonine-protein kinase [Rathayibacter sp. SD072]|uniref:serine/threonine-protein kinase n=1 Tax=Rathayibacter sp. SD072 TaxID=2781731 RepID=UPI001A95E24D|nr:serine/threonine-protein kinase [Rathayibacter sp. SD072]MBO0984592.1 serine/threonine protein kinase [Rathayibacter sp. SD072]
MIDELDLLPAGTSVDPLLGATLSGRYLVLERIGEGGSASVYRARDLRLARPVAVKVHRAVADTPNERARREREIRMLIDSRHSSVVEILDQGEIAQEEGELSYLVLEYFDPADPAAAWFSSRDERMIAEVGAQVADALAHLHARDVLHRDVKPENVLVRSRPVPAGSSLREAKLSDFGIARSVDDARLTRPDLLVGTAGYLSPESVGAGPVGPSSDVYSLGLVLLEALTGKRAYEGTTLEISLQRMHHAPVLPAGLPERWRALLAAMTALDPEERPSAATVAERLWSGLHGAGPTAPARMRLHGLLATVATLAVGALSALSLTGVLD